MDTKDFIPKDKGDFETVARLREIKFEELRLIIPEILVWLQDLHWPIARPIAEALMPHADKLTPDFINILKTNDGEWKYNVLVLFGRKTKDSLFLEEIKRIVLYPTQDEIREEVDIEATKIVNGEYNDNSKF